MGLVFFGKQRFPHSAAGPVFYSYFSQALLVP